MPFEVMVYRALRTEMVAGEGQLVVVPDGWQPLSAIAENEYVAILCCRQIDDGSGPAGPAPVIDSLDPAMMPSGGPDQSVDVYGSNFTLASTITVDDLARDTFLLSATHLQYTAQPSVAPKGEHIVKVVNPDASSNGVVFEYT